MAAYGWLATSLIVLRRSQILLTSYSMEGSLSAVYYLWYMYAFENGGFERQVSKMKLILFFYKLSKFVFYLQI